jgi:hypothetical protein
MKREPVRLIGGLLLAAGLATSAEAATPLQGQIALRPVTSYDLKIYNLPSSTEISSGLATVPIGQALYLDAYINKAIPATDIVSVEWALTAKPAGSAAEFGRSPLGAEVPPYNPADKAILQVAGRSLLRADLVGPYTITATITTSSSGSTNVTQNITAAKHMGLQTCMLCHSGGQSGVPDMVTPWSKTKHAGALQRGIDGISSDHFAAYCISCHSLGYNANTNAVNGGFDDVAAQVGWKFPPTLTNGNWAAMPAALKNVSNIQCENCHGPGSEHGFSDGILGNTNRISVSLGLGACVQCHDAMPYHFKNLEWSASKHAVATREPSGRGREGCVACHTAPGFVGLLSAAPTTNTVYEAITCTACHDPHDATNPHQIRTAGPVKLMDGFTTINNGGAGALCMNCHKSRRNATNYVETANATSTFGPHHSVQADMLAGVNAITYGNEIPSSSHGLVVSNSCVACHMQEVPAGSPILGKVGGHTFSIVYKTATNEVELTEACAECHGETETVNFVRQDYNADGVVEGVQEEVKGLLNRLALLLPPVGVPKTSLSINTNWTRKQLKGGYNWQFVAYDGSYGIHNTAYAVGLLRASIGDLTDDRNFDSLPDTWQTQYFGSATDPKANPNACPAGDGIPNWLKYNLGLDPMKKGIEVPGGVVWSSGATLINSDTEDQIAIYTAAEVVFNTEVGKTYQLEAISTLGDGWKAIGAPIAGTGTSMSFVTPTRQNVQQFYRVVHTP